MIVIIKDFSGLTGRLRANAIEIPPLSPHQVITKFEPFERLLLDPIIVRGIVMPIKRTNRIRGIKKALGTAKILAI